MSPRNRAIRTLILRIVVIAVIAALSGCSKFKSSRHMSLAPFAEDMIAIAGDIAYGLGQTHAVYTRGYHDIPEVEHMRVMATKARRIIRATIAYAMEVVSLSESRMSGPERSQALADYLDGLLRPVLEAPRPPLNLTIAQLDAIVGDVAAQKNLLDALGAREPSLAEVISSSSRPTNKDLVAIEQRIIFKLRSIREVRTQLAPDIELYWKRTLELQELIASFNAALRQARVAVIAWSRANQRLAAGVTDPAQIDLFGLARKAAGGVSPLP